MSNERSTQWVYSLQSKGENKMGGRTSTPRSHSYEAVGVDFSRKTGLRPFPGFTKGYSFSGLANGDVITDVLPVSFRVSANQFGYGFVYKYKPISDPTTEKIAVDYRIKGKSSGAWSTNNILFSGLTLNMPMDIAVFGKYVYVFSKGSEPVLFYVLYEVLY